MSFVRNSTWASYQGQSLPNGKEEDLFQWDAISPESFGANATFDPASIPSPMDTSTSPFALTSHGFPLFPPSQTIPLTFDTNSYVSNNQRGSLLSQQIREHASIPSHIDPALTTANPSTGGFPHSGSLGAEPGLTMSPSSQPCDSLGTPSSGCIHQVVRDSVHLHNGSFNSRAMNSWQYQNSLLSMRTGTDSSGLGSLPTSPLFDNSCLMSPDSYTSSPLLTNDGGLTGLPMPTNKAAGTGPMDIPSNRPQHGRRPSKGVSSIGSIQNGVFRPRGHHHPYDNSRQVGSPSSRPAAWMIPNSDHQPPPGFDMDFGMLMDELSSDIVSPQGSAPLPDSRPQPPRRRPKHHVEGAQEGASISLNDFTSTQLPAAMAIFGYQRVHPGTPIPTTLITSELAEIKDGKGRCLIGACASNLGALKRADHLHEHIRDRHFGCKPYRCSECTQSFSREHDLKRHHTVHSRDTCGCPVCGSSYSRIDNLKRHMQTKHPEHDFSGARASV